MSDQSVSEEPVTDEPVAEAEPETVTPEAVAETEPETVTPETATEPAAPGDVAVAEDDDAPEARKNARKVREGLVVSISMEKTAVVATVDRVRHRRYVKTVQRTKRLYAHDENNETRLGDRVRIVETRPLSKLKRWRIVEILERAK
jgi:small subunit ribosomal protein S17